MLRRIHCNVFLEEISGKFIFFAAACHLYFPDMILIFFSFVEFIIKIFAKEN